MSGKTIQIRSLVIVFIFFANLFVTWILMAINLPWVICGTAWPGSLEAWAVLVACWRPVRMRPWQTITVWDHPALAMGWVMGHGQSSGTDARLVIRLVYIYILYTYCIYNYIYTHTRYIYIDIGMKLKPSTQFWEWRKPAGPWISSGAAVWFLHPRSDRCDVGLSHAQGMPNWGIFTCNSGDFAQMGMQSNILGDSL